MNQQQQAPVPLQPVQFPIPQVGQPAQPNWDAMGQALDVLAQEAPLIAHMNVQAQLDALLNGVNQIIGGVNNINGRIARIEADLSTLPIRMINAGASDTAPLVYPNPHVPGGALPATKYDAYRINAAEALAALQALGVPNIPSTAEEQIKSFHEYVGLRTPAP